MSLDLDQLIGMFNFQKNRRMAAFRQRLIREEEDKAIDHRFTKALIKKLTGLSDKPLDDATALVTACVLSPNSRDTRSLPSVRSESVCPPPDSAAPKFDSTSGSTGDPVTALKTSLAPEGEFAFCASAANIAGMIACVAFCTPAVDSPSKLDACETTSWPTEFENISRFLKLRFS